ncbi:MAG: glycosyltransferase family 2 protein [Thiobacillaceae bacterium]
MNAPRFSVIIPAHNSAKTLARSIDSVLAQTWPAHEIIVVDDASSDETSAVATAFGTQIRYLRREHNSGVSAARNYGVEQANGDWLAFLDADDWYFPERLRLHAEWIVQDPSLNFLTGDYEYHDEVGNLLGLSMKQHESGRMMLQKAGGETRVIMQDADFEAFVADHFGDTHTLSVGRDLFLKAGGYPLGFKVCEDVHLLIRIVAQSKRAGVICQPLGVYLIHGASTTRRDPVAAQSENVRTLLDLKMRARDYPALVRRGVMKRLRDARLNMGYALAKQDGRWPAARAVLPSLLETPSLTSLRNLISVLR